MTQPVGEDSVPRGDRGRGGRLLETTAPGASATPTPRLARRIAGRLEGAATGVAWWLVLALLAVRLRVDPSFRRLVYRPAGTPGTVPDDWRVRLVVRARDGSFAAHAVIAGGRAHAGLGGLPDPDLQLAFRDAAAARRMLSGPASGMLEMLLRSDLVFEGNMSHAGRLGYVLSALFPRTGGRDPAPERWSVALPPPRRSAPMERCDAVKHLWDPALSQLTLDDFPRLRGFLRDFFEVVPELCTERARLYTEFLRENGFETDRAGRPWDAVSRQAAAFHHVMTRRAPRIRAGDLLAGTTTARDKGVLVYPECGGLVLWSELRTVSRREKNPYRISREDERVLDEEVNPFWVDRNVREYTRRLHGNPPAMRLDERFALYFLWKTQGVSHTMPDFGLVLRRGLRALAGESRAAAREAAGADAGRFHEAVALSLEGVLAYARALSSEAARQAKAEPDSTRRAELLELARISARVPAEPATTLHEALQSIWTVFIACHMENSNTGFSIGRLDTWLQPFFEADVARLPPGDAAALDAYVRHAVELAGCFLLRCTDHLPQVADLGNKLFAGSSSVQAITLGGIDAEGRNAVTDTTFVLLKAVEMLGLRDPNVNARFHAGVNSEAYLRRLCEVNVNTGATPSIHGDAAVIRVLQARGFTEAHARDWSATGCVEPTSCGRDYGNTNCGMFNLVAALEMALHDGWHPLLGEQVGPRTGAPASLGSFDALLAAFFAQLEFLAHTFLEANNWLGEAHAVIRPVPFLSALIAGPLERGKDLSVGGALYNSSGIGAVGLVDVVDSLVAVRQVVYEEKRIDLSSLVRALDEDFGGREDLAARLAQRVPKFGSGDPAPLEMARLVMARFDAILRGVPHYRGGYYKPGYWSMSNHVAFGLLTGALPSGRRRGAPFTPGCTPAPVRGVGLASQLHDVAALEGRHAGNNLAFNVKVVPAPHDSPAETARRLAAYVRTYVEEGGMQVQFNVMDSALLRDAKAHPGRYPTLMVRLSGYNAYFDDLDEDTKQELIDRTEHRLAG